MMMALSSLVDENNGPRHCVFYHVRRLYTHPVVHSIGSFTVSSDLTGIAHRKALRARRTIAQQEGRCFVKSSRH